MKEMVFQEWALPRIKENFGVPGYDMEHGDSIVNKFLKKQTWKRFYKSEML